ncbi:30S ribosome-binding factor RbfA [Isosphaeraceae bacterium EP7]
MPSHRSLRIAEAIREVVSQAILFEVADPRVKSITVLHAEVSSDLHAATVYVSIMGDEKQQKLSMRGLQHATGFLQARVAARLQTRSTPVLKFKEDDSVKKSVSMSRLIEETLEADRLARGGVPAPEASPVVPNLAREVDETDEDAEDENDT